MNTFCWNLKIILHKKYLFILETFFLSNVCKYSWLQSLQTRKVMAWVNNAEVYTWDEIMSRVRLEGCERNIMVMLSKARLETFLKEKGPKINCFALKLYTGASKLYSWASKFGEVMGAWAPRATLDPRVPALWFQVPSGGGNHLVLSLALYKVLSQVLPGLGEEGYPKPVQEYPLARTAVYPCPSQDRGNSCQTREWVLIYCRQYASWSHAGGPCLATIFNQTGYLGWNWA